MRADFYPELMMSDFRSIPPNQRIDIVPLSGADLEDAIVKPAAKRGVLVEEGLAKRLVSDAADEPGMLPFVQETMAILWGNMVDHQLSIEAYESLGHHGRNGLAVAIATKADAALYELSDSQQVIARRILLRLVQFGEGRADTRRQLPITALYSQGDDRHAFEDTLRHLTKNRLLTISGEVKQLDKTIKVRDFVKVDIAHEVLITGWPTLQEWLSELREAEQIRRRLENKVDEWKRLGRGVDGLLDRAGLSEAEGWIQGINASILGYDEALLELVEASRKAIEEIEQERIARATAEATQKRLEFLAEASKLLVSSFDTEMMLSNIAKLAVPYLADGCAMDLVLDDGTIRRVAIALRDSVRQMSSADSESRYFPDLDVFDQGLRAVQSQIVPDVREALFATTVHNYEQLKRLHTLGVKSFLVAPLLARGRMVGAIALIMVDQDRHYSSNDLDLVEDLASRIGLTVDNARLYIEAQRIAAALQRKVTELGTLLEAARVLSSSLLPREVLDMLMELVGQQLAVSTVVLWTINSEGSLVCAAAAGIPPETARRLRIQIGQGLTGHVATTFQPLVSTKAEHELDTLGLDFKPDRQYTSFMGVPVLYRERIMGVLSVMSVEQRDFSTDEVALLAGVADQAAIALQNASLFEERERRIAELATLNRISQEISATLEQDELLAALHRGISEVLDTSESFIALYDRETRRLSFPISRAAGRPLHDDEEIVVDDGASLINRVITERRPLLLRTQQEVEALATTEAPALGRPISSWLGVPIIGGDEVLGILNVQSHEPNAFDQDDLRFLATVASQAAIAINNVRLFQSEQTRRRVADTLREVAQTLTSVLKLDEITALILDELARVVPYDTASLMLREDNVVSIVATRGFEELIRSQIEQLSVALENDANLAQIVQTRRPLVFNDAQDSPYRTQLKGMEHCHGWIGVPLLVDDEVIGLLTVESSTVGTYDEEDGQLAFALASQAAHALRNARLVEQQQQYAVELQRRMAERTAALADANIQLSAEKERFQAIHDITVELTENLDLEETLIKALGLASRTVGVKRGSIMMRDPRIGTLICRAVLTADGMVEATNIPISFAQGSGLAGWVLSQERGLYISDVRKDQRWLREEGRADEVRSVLAVPLITKDEPLGVLILSSPKLNYFGEAQLQLLSTIANEIAIVIHNAELYSYINDLASQLAEAYEQQRQETSNSQAILQSMTDGVIVLDEKQHVVLFNPAAEQVLGIPASFALRQPLAHLKEYQERGVSARRAELAHTALYEGLHVLDEQGRAHHTILKLPTPDQSISINFTQVVRPDGVCYGSVAVLRDVTREVG